MLLVIKKDREIRCYLFEQKETRKKKTKTNEPGDMRGGLGWGEQGMVWGYCSKMKCVYRLEFWKYVRGLGGSEGGKKGERREGRE